MFRVIRFNYTKSNDILAKCKTRKEADAICGMHGSMDPEGHYYIDTVSTI